MRPIGRDIVLVALGAAFALAPAIINGFPFVYSDTGTYLRSAFTGHVPFDRPYWYGAFVRLSSMDGRSLWGVAAVQSLLCAIWVLRVMRLALPNLRSPAPYLALMLLLTAGTGMGWYAGLLIPDVFTGIGLLAIYALLHPASRPAGRLADAALIIAACWFHTSNLLILPASGLVLILFQGRSHRPVRMALWLTVSMGVWGSLALANWLHEGEAYASRNGHVFLMGRMLDLGMLGPYLEEHCAEEAFFICQYRDSLPPHSQEFLWGERSPVQLQGGWEATKEEYNRIVRGSFLEPRYLLWHVRGSVEATWRQLMMWEVCHAMRSDWYRLPESAPRSAIASYVPSEEARFMRARQNGGRGELSMRWPDALYRIVLAASLLVALIAAIRPGGEQKDARRMLGFAVAAVVIGAWVCASLSIADSRYLGRDSWVLPIAAFLFAAANGWLGSASAPARSSAHSA